MKNTLTHSLTQSLIFTTFPTHQHTHTHTHTHTTRSLSLHQQTWRRTEFCPVVPIKVRRYVGKKRDEPQQHGRDGTNLDAYAALREKSTQENSDGRAESKG